MLKLHNFYFINLGLQCAFPPKICTCKFWEASTNHTMENLCICYIALMWLMRYSQNITVLLTWIQRVSFSPCDQDENSSKSYDFSAPLSYNHFKSQNSTSIWHLERKVREKGCGQLFSVFSTYFLSYSVVLWWNPWITVQRGTSDKGAKRSYLACTTVRWPCTCWDWQMFKTDFLSCSSQTRAWSIKR